MIKSTQIDEMVTEILGSLEAEEAIDHIVSEAFEFHESFISDEDDDEFQKRYDDLASNHLDPLCTLLRNTLTSTLTTWAKTNEVLKEV